MPRGGSVPCRSARAGKGTGPAGGKAKSQAPKCQAGTGRCRWGNGSWVRAGVRGASGAGGWQCRCSAGLGPRGAAGQALREGARRGGRQRGVLGREGHPSRDACAPPQILLRHLTSTKAWERERALQVCAQLLGTYEELFKCSVSREPRVPRPLSLLATAPTPGHGLGRRAGTGLPASFLLPRPRRGNAPARSSAPWSACWGLC